jgi:hypothetical protein
MMPPAHKRFLKALYLHSQVDRAASFWNERRKPLRERVEVSERRVAVIDTDRFQPGAALFEAELDNGRVVGMRGREHLYPFLVLAGQQDEIEWAVQQLLKTVRS